MKKTYFLLFFLMLLYACGKEKITLDWVSADSHTTSLITSISFVDDTNGYAVGGEAWTKAVALETHDGGYTWTSDSIGQKLIWSVQFDQNGKGYAVGQDGLLYIKADPDATWETLRPRRWDINLGIAVYDGEGLIVSGAAYENGVIQRMTADYLTELVDTFDNELTAVCYSDAHTAHIVGYGVVLRSTDAGDSWKISPVEGDFFQDVYFPSPKVGYIVGYSGSILKTTDGGENWKWQRKGDGLTVKNHPFRAVHFADESRGYIVGDKGTFWRTVDGGDSWQVDKNFPEVDFYDVYSLADGGCVVGVGGTIIRFED